AADDPSGDGGGYDVAVADCGHRLQCPPDSQTDGREVVRVGEADHDSAYGRDSDECHREADGYGSRVDDPLNAALDERVPAAWCRLESSFRSSSTSSGGPLACMALRRKSKAGPRCRSLARG